MKAEIITALQGSDAWHQHRANHYNASDLAAAMGMSSYKSRNELIREKATGFVRDIDEATERRFAKGHEYEAIARPWAEEIIGDDLFPVVLAAEVDGLKLSASMDGITMTDDVSWEHKSGNAELLESLKRGAIPPAYHPQLEQGLMLSGASRCLFMASSGDRSAMCCAWYESSPELRAKIIPTWRQLAEEVAAYRHIEILPAAVAEPVMSLPSVSVQMNGSIAVISNLELFGEKLNAFVDGLDLNPSDDQAFANTEQAIKTLQKAQDALEAAEAGALAQTASIEEMRRTVRLYVETARTTRLMLDKLVKARKEQLRIEIVRKGQDQFTDHIESLNQRLGKPYMPMVPADFAGAIKGKRTVDSIRDAVNTTLANAKIDASATADKIQANLTTLRELAANHAFLFADASAIVLKAPDDLTMLVKSRIAEHQQKEEARIEAETARIRAEVEQQERAKAERAAREQAEADAKVRREAEAAERARLAEAAAAELKAAQQSPVGAELSPAAQALNEQQGAQRFAQAHPAAKVAKVVSMPVKPAAPSVREQINARLDLLDEAELQRVLSFVQSRYGMQATA